MNLLLFFWVIVVISQLGQSSFLTRDAAVGVNNDNGDPDQVDMNKGSKIATTAQLTRATNDQKLYATLYVSCACGKGETDTDGYIKGELHYYADHKYNSKIIRREKFGKTPRIDNKLSPTFKNFAKVTNETDPEKVGAYIELWDHDRFTGDDFLGSFTFRHPSISATYINTKAKSRDNHEAEAEKCPLSNGAFANCGNKIADANFYVSTLS